jgi:DNA-binding FadR family transcriptional regulator
MNERGITRERVLEMGFSKINNQSLTNQVVVQIEDMILSGELEIGEKLPSARDLCEMLGVSRPVISAAMIELSKLGFVRISPRQGIYVEDYMRKGTVETMATVMRYNKGMMKKEEVLSLLQVRAAMESLCVKLVIEVATEEQLQEIAPLVAAIDVENPQAAAEGIFAFHHELAVISGNMLLPLVYYSFKSQSILLWEQSCQRIGVKEHYEQKRQLYQALLDRDKREAESLVSESITYAIKQLSFLIQ